MEDLLLGVRRRERDETWRSEWESVVREVLAAVEAKKDNLSRRIGAGHSSGIEIGLYVDGPNRGVHHVEVHECGGLLARITLDVRARDDLYTSANPSARALLDFVGQLLGATDDV